MMISVSKKLTLQCVCVSLFISCSRESPVDLKENSTVSEATHFMDEAQDFHTVTDDTFVPRNSSIERWNHSRMLLKSTTLGYDEWWFLTTQRTPISYKDFPGRPGVATWKEINPGESRDSRKLKTSPTAEAASGTWKLHPNALWLYIVLYLTFEHFFHNP
ncbi:uncharacterized protein [Parasteatoda tepidariorum]|nr:uncharacterized protein LOC107446158 [Parasteatoda tepidariorum]